MGWGYTSMIQPRLILLSSLPMCKGGAWDELNKLKRYLFWFLRMINFFFNYVKDKNIRGIMVKEYKSSILLLAYNVFEWVYFHWQILF